VLAMLEKASDAKAHKPERALDWTSTAVTIEHILPQSSGGTNDALQVKIDEIGNLALLEKRLNHQLGSKDFEEKIEAYRASDFGLTRALAEATAWTPEDVTARTANF